MREGMIEMTEEYVPAVWRAGRCDWRSTAVDTATGKPALKEAAIMRAATKCKTTDKDSEK